VSYRGLGEIFQAKPKVKCLFRLSLKIIVVEATESRDIRDNQNMVFRNRIQPIVEVLEIF
jgi:hypothetical protein